MGYDEVDIVRLGCPKGKKIINVSLNYLQPKIAVATRKWPMSCIGILRIGHNEVDAVRLGCPKGKNG
jgi:hypothetical protein